MRRVLLTLAAVLYLTPVAQMVLGSLHGDGSEGGWPTLENYRQVFQRVPFLRHLLNSLMISAAVVGLGLLVNASLAYALARLRWRGRGFVWGALLALLVVPFEVVAVPLFYAVSLAGWRDTYLVQILPFVAQPVSVYLFYTFFTGFPRELEEAARLDGADSLRILVGVIAPNAGPAFAAVGLTTFLSIWGAYLWPLLVTSGEAVRPLPLALATFKTQPPIEWGDIYAFSVLTAVPVAGLFWLAQPWFARSLASTGLKG